METIQAHKIAYKRPGGSISGTSSSKVLICKSFNLDSYGVLHISGFMEKVKDPNGTGFLDIYQDTVDAPEFMYIHTDYTLEKINIQV